MIKKVNIKEAQTLVSENKYVCVFFGDEECEACKKYCPEVAMKLPDLFPNWKFIKVQKDLLTDEEKYFMPFTFPMTYIFKEKTRMLVGDGYAPLEEVSHILRCIENDEPWDKENTENKGEQ